MKTYHIKAGYNHKAGLATQVHQAYWTAKRIYSSGFHQFQVYQYARRLIEERGYKSVADVGCGPGTKLAMLHRALPDRRFIGIDLPEGIEYCRNTYDFGEWYSDDFNNSHLGGSDKYDLVICSDVIEHVEDPDTLLEYLKVRCTPNGRILLSTPERDILNGPISMMAPNRHHIREWNGAELLSYLKASGFTVEHQELQYPVRFWPNTIFYREIVLRALRGHKLKYNQLVLLRVI